MKGNEFYDKTRMSVIFQNMGFLVGSLLIYGFFLLPVNLGVTVLVWAGKLVRERAAYISAAFACSLCCSAILASSN